MSAEKKLQKARAGLVMDQPFFGSLILRMKMIENNKLTETMGTDGKNIFYNSKFVDSLTLAQLMAVLCHEVMHVVLMHHLRRGKRDRKKWNVAADYAINPILIDSGFTLTGGALLDDRYREKNADEIYTLLPQDWNQNKQTGQGQSDPGGMGEVLDYPGNPSPAEKNKLEQQTKIAVKQAAKVASAAGNLPGELKRLIDDLTEPVINWREILWRFVQNTAKTDFTWSKPNKRFIGQGLYMPSMKGEELKPGCLAIDTSGSIDQKALNDFTSELTAILEEYETNLNVLCCDAVIQSVEEYSRNDLPLNIKTVGGGGTDFRPPFEWADASGKDIAYMIYFTDLCCYDFPEEAPTYPVLWVKTGNYTKEQPPFGEIVALQ
jgi:predicted metal-dependent peptidase